MKIFLWVVVALIGLFWTGLAALGASLVGWGAGALASGGAAEWARVAGQWPVPAWIGVWIDPAAVKALQDALLWGLQALQQSLPWVASAVGWLVPLVWVTWGFGLLLLLLLAFVAHVLIGRGSQVLPRAGA
jgi:hypothetical protein